MPRIQSYDKDTQITDNDILLASDSNDSNKTKNISIGDLKAYIIPSGGTAGQVLKSDGAGGVYWSAP
tara:strand:+ start:345 stop:545 length:201 start_codon:yes stop_codon:yes gene_type:complete